MLILKLDSNDLFSENVLLNEFQTCSRLKVNVARQYNDANQVIRY